MTRPVELIPASGIRPRQFIRVHNRGVDVLEVNTQNGMTRIRFAASHGDDMIEIPAGSMVPRYQGTN